MRSALPLAAITIAVALLLSGCVPQDPEVIPPPEPSTEPIFASDEEALAAATEAYKAYLAMSDLIAQGGGVNPERLEPFVSAELLDDEGQTFERISQDQLHQVGSTTFDNVTLQQLDQQGDYTLVSMYLCLDFVDVELLDASGSTVTPVQEDRWPFEALFERSNDANSSLVLIGHEPWSGSNFCR